VKCLHCGDDLRWNNDFDTEDDDQYNIVSMYECMNEQCKALRWNNDFDTEDDDQYLIVSMYECMNEQCKAWYEIYHGLKEKETVN